MGDGKEAWGEKEGWAWWEVGVARREKAWSVKAWLFVRFYNYQVAFLNLK